MKPWIEGLKDSTMIPLRIVGALKLIVLDDKSEKCLRVNPWSSCRLSFAGLLAVLAIGFPATSIHADSRGSRTSPTVEPAADERKIGGSETSKPPVKSRQSVAERARDKPSPPALENRGVLADVVVNPGWLIIAVLVTNLGLFALLLTEVIRNRRYRNSLGASSGPEVSTALELLREIVRLLRGCLGALEATSKGIERPLPLVPGQSLPSDPLPETAETVTSLSRPEVEANLRVRSQQLPVGSATAPYASTREPDAVYLVNSYCRDRTLRCNEFIQKVGELGLEVAAPGPFSNRGALNHAEADETRLLAIQERRGSSKYLVVLRDEVSPDLNFWSDLFEIPKEAKIGGAKVRCVEPATFDVKGAGNVLTRGKLEVVQTSGGSGSNYDFSAGEPSAGI